MIFENNQPTTPSLSLENVEPLSEIEKLNIWAEIDLGNCYRDAYYPEPTASDGYNEQKKRADFYQSLASAYGLWYDTEMKEEGIIIQAEGVIVELYSDVFKYEKSKGNNDKTSKQRSRILILQHVVKKLSTYMSMYRRCKIMLYNACNREAELTIENKKLKKQIEDIKSAHNF